MTESWSPPLRPAIHAEQTLITAILEGEFPPGGTLPSERELAKRLGVTRPTLREALQRLERDGWIVIKQGKPTRVNDIWVHGGLNVLSALVRSDQALPADFIPNLLGVREVLAPEYARAAVQNNPQMVVDFLNKISELDELPEAYAAFDWQLHHLLTVASGNPIYTLILNGFAGFYEQMAQRYFRRPVARSSSRAFYTALQESAVRGDTAQAEAVTRRVMQASLALWQSEQNET